MKSSVQKKHWLSAFLWVILFCSLALPEVQADEKIILNGKWVKGPGFDLFKDKLDLPIVAEDLGFMDDDFIEFM